jgi:phospholipase A2-like protein
MDAKDIGWVARRFAIVGIFAVTGFGWFVPTLAGLSASLDPANVRGSSHCQPVAHGTAHEYLMGLACPPDGFAEAFGYRPALVKTPNGWRFTRPGWTGSRCNGPAGDEGPFWDFAVACRTHDYGYDLLRFGLGDRRDVDELLYSDMMAHCDRRGFIEGTGCRSIARWARAVLKAGDVLGFDPERIAHTAQRR